MPSTKKQATRSVSQTSLVFALESLTKEGEEKALRCPIAKGEDRTASPKSKI
ncbi:MAG: hypothetical protein V7K89_19120 [Nostoc sp.]|uniref:hypothetical protein n=1 Tax=Nostoc sp. TaxID=1180 RepID=UPI002FF473D8